MSEIRKMNFWKDFFGFVTETGPREALIHSEGTMIPQDWRAGARRPLEYRIMNNANHSGRIEPGAAAALPSARLAGIAAFYIQTPIQIEDLLPRQR